MKKLAILLSFLFILTSFVGCSNIDSKSYHTSDFKTCEPIADNISLYREDISSNGGLNGFNSSDTINQLVDFEELNLYSYYYPIIYTYNKTLYLWTTDSFGTVFVTNLENKETDTLTDLHYYPEKRDEEIINLNQQFSITYTSDDEKIHVWEFGTEIENYSMSREAIFCGLSDVGYIFRLGTDVYSFRYNMRFPGIVCIAHNVKSVISINYCYDSGHQHQPLLLMQDGDIKVYLDDGLYTGIEPDNYKLLRKPIYEGGYH